MWWRVMVTLFTTFAMFMVSAFLFGFFGILTRSDRLGDLAFLFGAVGGIGFIVSLVTFGEDWPDRPPKRLPRADRKRIAREVANARADAALDAALREIEGDQ